MKRIFFIRVAAFIFMGFFACASIPIFGQSVSSVWKVSKDDRELFLGGSIHILRAGDFPLPEQFDRAFAASSMLVLEADIEQADETLAPHLMTRFFLDDGQTLETILEPETYTRLMEKCGEYEIPIEAIAIFKPTMIVNILTILELQRGGFLENGVDMHYLEKAKQAEMPLAFLETMESQIEMLVTMGDGYENDFVKYSLESMDKNIEAELESTVSSWRSGDAKHNEAVIAEIKEMWPVFYKRLLANRNAAWLPLLQNYLTTDTVAFVIVGHLHMYGEDGLLTQLENAGCIVEQLQ